MILQVYLGLFSLGPSNTQNIKDDITFKHIRGACDVVPSTGKGDNSTYTTTKRMAERRLQIERLCYLWCLRLPSSRYLTPAYVFRWISRENHNCFQGFVGSSFWATRWYIYPWPYFLQFIEPPTAPVAPGDHFYSFYLLGCGLCGLSTWWANAWGPRSEKNGKKWKMYWEGWDEKWMKVSIHVGYGRICQSRLGWDSLIFMLRGFGDVAMVFAMMPWFFMGISKTTSARSLSSTWNENAGNPLSGKKDDDQTLDFNPPFQSIPELRNPWNPNYSSHPFISGWLSIWMIFTNSLHRKWLEITISIQ